MMKKIIFILLIQFITGVSIIAQSNTHLTFKNIPIDGKVPEFIAKMKVAGFSFIETDGEITIMEGEFVNQSCKVYIVATPLTKIVWKVAVYLPEDTNWFSLESDYNKYTKQFEKKYGVPTKIYNFFSKPYYNGDGYETQALKMEKCHYFSYWDINDGTISVSISKFCKLIFSYEDKINTKKASREKEDKIQGDI